MTEQHFLVRFWGVRGSYPTTGHHTLRHGGNTSCVEVQIGREQGHTLIFDAGSGIIRLGETLMSQSQHELNEDNERNTYDEQDEQDGQALGREREGSLDISLFITHGHGDHLIGFPFFAPLFEPQANIDIFGPQLADHSVEQLVTQMMSPPYFPVDVHSLPSQRTFHTIVDEQCISWNDSTSRVHSPSVAMLPHIPSREEVCVSAKFTQSHPLDGAIIYRIEYAGRCVVYATDVEWEQGCENAFLDFVRGADVLIHDAQYTSSDYERGKHGYGHSTVEMAVEAARNAHVGELILFHHEPMYDDDQLDHMEAEARKQFARTRSAYEGMEIDLLG